MSDRYAYRVMWSEDDAEYVGLCAEFPSLSWLDKSQDKAFKGIRQLVKEVIVDLKSQNEPIPEAISTKTFSGKFVVRVPAELHRKLVLEAQESHVSLNRYVSHKLASRSK
ncbi:MAG: type II toxin-antitoxin system HicB family antitoxin [Gammaproteobacteria bacterium]|nr:type II toxin-antitoxin system HicB family antitoxin [Gammaproteobacteria bacterium]